MPENITKIFSTGAEATGELTQVSMEAAAYSGRLAVRLGGCMARRIRPGYVPPDVLARQATLRRFEGRLGIAGNLMDLDPDSLDSELEANVSSTASDMVDGGLVDEDTTVELRTLLPADVLRSPTLSIRREKVVRMLGHTLVREHGVEAILNTHPIILSEHEGSQVDIDATWSAVTSELDGFLHQMNRMRRGPGQHLAMMAITGYPYTQAIFENRVHVSRGQLEEDGLLVLDHVGKVPEDNRLVSAL